MNSVSNASGYRSRYSKQRHNVQQRSLFLPIMLCSRSAIKDVKFSAHRSLSNDPSSPRLGCTDQVKRNNKVIGYPPPPPPSHPHHKLNFSTTATATRKVRPSPPPPMQDYYSNSSSFTYHKLRRFFSSRSLITSPITSSFIATTSTSKVRSAGGGVDGGSGGSRAGRRVVLVNGGRSTSKIDNSNKKSYSGSINIGSDDSGDLGILNIAELDPPLPVVKRVVQQPGTTDGDSEKDNLWKRRFGGIASLQTLQVQSVHGNNVNLPVPARTV